MPYEVLLFIVSIIIPVAWYLIDKVIKLSAQQDLLDHVIFVRKYNLYSYIFSFQKKLSLPKEYRIATEQEELYAKRILANFEDFIVSKYFNKELVPIRSGYVVSGEQFFARMLWVYLKQHSCNGTVCGEEMHDNQLSRRTYGESFSSGWDATYSLTPFGIVYYKLYYIVFRFLGTSPIFNQKGTLFQESDAAFIKETIDTATISISYMQKF